MRRLLFALLFLCANAYGQSCTTTLSAGAAVGTSISSAAAGDTICLNNGNYSGFTLNGVTKSPRVTVRAVNSGNATFTSQINLGSGTSGLTFDGVNYAGVSITGTSTNNLTFKNGDASQGTMEIDGVTTATPNILFDNLTSTDQDNSGFCRGAPYPCVGAAAYHFSFSGRSSPVATIRHATINGGCADGIQSGVPFILEYSKISNKIVGTCPNDPHTDATQLYGGPFSGTIIRYNYYYANVQVVAAYDGVDGVLIEHNVFDPGASGERRECQIELYSDDTSTVQNNTIIDRGSGFGYICLDKKPADDNGFGTVIRNNIAAGISALNGSNWGTKDKNMVTSGATGTDFNGSPTFEGTCSGGASNWRNCALTDGSSGHNAGSDGTDVGTHYYGIGKPTGLSP